MRYGIRTTWVDLLYFGSVSFLLLISTTILASVESRLFPLQWVYLLAGVLVFWLGTRLDRIVLFSVSPILFIIVVVALSATLVLGIVSGGALRWLPLGPLTIQPSEFAKPAVVVISAWILSRDMKYGFFFRQKFLFSLFFSFLVGLLVFIQPDLGTALIIISAWFGTILGSGVSLKTVFRFLGFSVVILPLIWFLLAPYQKERVLSFLSPSDLQGASYQGFQAMIAAGSGGLFGRGLGQGSQTQLAFLPAHHTDFIFASIGEELGFLGMGLVILAFFILFWRIIYILGDSRDSFSKGVVSGIFAYLLLQTFINISMNLGMLPIAGVPLPLVSSGGSALVSTMFALGLVLGLRRL